MRMARINIYLPDELARAAKEAGLNVSRLTQAALSDALAATDTDRWLRERCPRSTVHACLPCGRNGRTRCGTRSSWVQPMADGLVLDASAMVDLLIASPQAIPVRDQVRGHAIHVPAHFDAEVLLGARPLWSAPPS